MENESSFQYMDEISLSSAQPNLKYTLRIIVHVLLFLMGVPGNSLIILVYKNKRQKTSTHVFIMTLAMADLSVCLMRVLDIAAEAFHLAGYPTPQVIHLLRPIEYTAIGTTVIVTSLISADRYDCVCRSQRRFLNLKRGKIAALVSLALSIAINVPAIVDSIDILFTLACQFLTYQINLIMIIVCYRLVYITVRQHTRVGTDSTLQGSNDGNSSTTTTTHASSTNQATVSVIVDLDPSKATCADVSKRGNHHTSSLSRDNPPPSIVTTDRGIQVGLSMLYTIGASHSGTSNRVADATHRTQVTPRAHAPASVLQRKTTKMLFITSVVFLLTWLPYWIYVSSVIAITSGWMPYWIFVGKTLARELGIRINPVFYLITDEGRIFVYVNNNVNPIIYGFSNSRFRKDCRIALGKIRLF
ncbi:cholecystokinin receptor type A-like [Asterias rubens]|uniref:cholecystokinin receptor type A-like n=1 Tax=Asterias rubens TaxID=7604 RepID=UPI0014558035|nr:cholecystokinin receptor type A-like [Asterias rubens]